MIVPYKGNEALGSAKPDLKENSAPRENEVEALCMEEGRADLRVTTIERFVVRLVCYSRIVRKKGVGRRAGNSHSFHQLLLSLCGLMFAASATLKMLLQHLKHEVYITYKSSVRTSQKTLCLHIVDKVNAIYRTKHFVHSVNYLEIIIRCKYNISSGSLQDVELID
jgi:hypothetical protein